MKRTHLHLFAAAVVLGLATLAHPLVAGAQISKVPDSIVIDPGGRIVPLPVPVKPVPEPAAIALFAAGLGLTAFALRRAIRR